MSVWMVKLNCFVYVHVDCLNGHVLYVCVAGSNACSVRVCLYLCPSFPVFVYLWVCSCSVACIHVCIMVLSCMCMFSCMCFGTADFVCCVCELRTDDSVCVFGINNSVWCMCECLAQMILCRIYVSIWPNRFYAATLLTGCLCYIIWSPVNTGCIRA